MQVQSILRLTLSFITIALLPTKVLADSCYALTFTGNAEYPPILWRDRDNPGKLTGIAVQVLQEALETDNVSVTTKDSGPWSRAQQSVRKGNADGLAGAFFTSERAEYLDYISPALMSIPNVLFVRADSTLNFTSWEQLKPLRGVTLINNSFGQEFDLYAQEHLDISTVHSVTLAFKMLVAGRSDYLIYELQPGQAYSDTLGMGEKIRPLDRIVNAEALHYAMSKKSHCNTRELRNRLEYHLKTQITPEQIEKLTLKYRQLWQQQATR